MPHPTFVGSILILSIYLCLGLPSGLLISGFPTKTLHAILHFSIHATCPVHLSLLDLIVRMIFGKEYRAYTCLYSVSIAGEICHRSDFGVCMVGTGDKREIKDSAVSMYVHNCKARFLEREKFCVISS
jgi:hypothetical protein